MSQKEACGTLITLRELMNQSTSLPSLLAHPLSPPPSPLQPSQIGNLDHFINELQTFYKQVNGLELDDKMQGLSDSHLYDEDEEEDLILRYQHIRTKGGHGHGGHGGGGGGDGDSDDGEDHEDHLDCD